MTGMRTIRQFSPLLLLIAFAACSDAEPGPLALDAGPRFDDATTAPAAPQNLAGSPQSISSIRVTWTDAANNEATFQLYQRSLTPPATTYTPFALIATLPANATSFVSSGLSSGTWYQYQLRACNRIGCSTFTISNPVLLARPNAPTGLTATPVSTTQINLAWADASNNETYFRLYRRRLDPPGVWSAWTEAARPTTNAVSYSDTGLTPNTWYQYQIQACNTAGCSAWNVAQPKRTIGEP